jgi:hypothetical protein
MPMMPSPVAGLMYAAVKVAGYALFGEALNRYAKKPARPLRFGLGKTALGLVGGVTYLFLIYSSSLEHSSDLLIAVVVGTVWSYALDGVMALIYRVLPGMVMPFC